MIVFAINLLKFIIKITTYVHHYSSLEYIFDEVSPEGTTSRSIFRMKSENLHRRLTRIITFPGDKGKGEGGTFLKPTRAFYLSLITLEMCPYVPLFVSTDGDGGTLSGEF